MGGGGVWFIFINILTETDSIRYKRCKQDEVGLIFVFRFSFFSFRFSFFAFRFSLFVFRYSN